MKYFNRYNFGSFQWYNMKSTRTHGAQVDETWRVYDKAAWVGCKKYKL